MRINLLDIFQRDLSEKSTVSEEELQTSFEFDVPPRVVFVNNIRSLKKIKRYVDLPTYDFNAADAEKIKITRQEIEKADGYDGDQLLLEDMHYNRSENIIYLTARRAKYAFIRTLCKNVDAGGFDTNSPFYGKIFVTTGVRSPFIARDDHTFFMMRARSPKVFSVAAGLLETSGKLHPKQFSDLVNYTAVKESVEEFLGDTRFASQRVDIEKLFGITSIAMRRKGNRIEVEFIVPMALNCDGDFLNHVLKTNRAQDAHEHAPGGVAISLNAQDRTDAQATLNKLPIDGLYVRAPIVAATSRLTYQRTAGSPCFFGKIPDSNTTFLPVSALEAKLLRSPYTPYNFESIHVTCGIQPYATKRARSR